MKKHLGFFAVISYVFGMLISIVAYIERDAILLIIGLLLIIVFIMYLLSKLWELENED